MKCAWQAYLQILPMWLRKQVDELGRESLQELRLRVDRPPELVLSNRMVYLERIIIADDLQYCINTASRYSPWVSTTIRSGYITAPGGHRIGICGEASIVENQINTISTVTSLCIRVARDFPGIARSVANLPGSIIVIGRPGTGKTTFLRDLARQKSNLGEGAVAVVDEREELFPIVNGSFCFPVGQGIDVLSGVKKALGIHMMIRTMNPRFLVVDEITDVKDSMAILNAGWCGVSIIASAHGESLDDFLRRPVYKPLVDSGLFSNGLIMQADKSWKLERMNECKLSC